MVASVSSILLLLLCRFHHQKNSVFPSFTCGWEPATQGISKETQNITRRIPRKPRSACPRIREPESGGDSLVSRVKSFSYGTRLGSEITGFHQECGETKVFPPLSQDKGIYPLLNQVEGHPRTFTHFLSFSIFSWVWFRAKMFINPQTFPLNPIFC